MSQTPWLGSACCFVLPPYWSLGGGKTLPRTSIRLWEMLRPNSWTYGSLLKSARDQVVDLPLSVRSRSCGGLDHGGGLHV